jgi:hypothetical protein
MADKAKEGNCSIVACSSSRVQFPGGVNHCYLVLACEMLMTIEQPAYQPPPLPISLVLQL